MSSGYWTTCTIVCWLIPAIAGILVFLVAREPTSFIAALLVGMAFAVFLGLVLTRLFCSSTGADADHVEAGAVAGDTAQSGAEAAAKAEADAKPDAEAMPEKASPVPDYDGDGIREGTDEGTRPAALSGPREGGADNLKEIKGIGPKLEALCNELGFYHFDQIAAWTADEVAWVDANLQGFKGRVSRDEWVAQAKILAAGGETEFSKRVEDGDVY